MSDAPKRYIGALDQGTTSTRFILFGDGGEQMGIHQVEHKQYYPKSGWVEHDPVEIFERSKECIDSCMGSAARDHGIQPCDVKAIGITNQRETTVVWDRHTGRPLYNAVVWLDTRTMETCDKLEEDGKLSPERVRELSGLPISTYFSGVKLRWLCDNVPEVAVAVADGSALFGTIDSWLTWCFTEEQVHVTDVTNAGRTMLMNIRTLEWEDELLDALDIPRSILPEIRSSSEVYGMLGCTVLKGVPIAGIVGDQQAALIGQSAFEPGQAKNTYGTGCFLIVNTGEVPQFSTSGLLTTPAYKLGPDAPCVYSLEGSIAVGGAAVSWLKDNLNLISKASEMEALAGSVDDTGDVYFVPAFSGLYAPHWRKDARGSIFGLTQYTSKAHIARATLAGMAFQVNDVLQAAAEDMKAPLKELRVDGGASINNLLLQMQADVLGFPVVRPKIVETTALGAAFAAGMAVGVHTGTSAVTNCWQADRRFHPVVDDERRALERRKWALAVEKSMGWAGKA
jgi:glycerol kinase